MIHPVVSPQLLFLNYRSIVEVLNNQKQSVSNAFQYVVLHPSAPSFSNDIDAAMSGCSCKSTKNMWNNSSLSEKICKMSPKVWKIREKQLEKLYLCTILHQNKWQRRNKRSNRGSNFSRPSSISNKRHGHLNTTIRHQI